MPHLVTASSDGRRCLLLRLVPMTFLLCTLTLAAATSSAAGHGIATPAPALSPNGCPPERADQGYICPRPEEASYPLIEYLYSNRAIDAISIKLTPDGVTQSLSCEGAAEITSMVIRLYERIPKEGRARDSIVWAETRMIDEIHAHAELGQYPQFRATANPVDIVFPHYEGASGGLWSLGQQVVFGSVLSCR